MMKKRDILLAVGIIAIALLAILLFSHRKGSIRIATPGVELQLRGGFAHRVTVRSGPEPTEVRACRYEPILLKTTRQQDGNTWQLQCMGPWGKLQKITVADGQTTTIDAGAPLLLKPEVSRTRDQVFIGFCIYGKAGEKYGNVIFKNGRRASAPEVRIIDKAGDLLASGRFQYG